MDWNGLYKIGVPGSRRKGEKIREKDRWTTTIDHWNSYFWSEKKGTSARKKKQCGREKEAGRWGKGGEEEHVYGDQPRSGLATGRAGGLRREQEEREKERKKRVEKRGKDCSQKRLLAHEQRKVGGLETPYWVFVVHAEGKGDIRQRGSW